VFGAVIACEEDVVVALGVERGVEVDEVDRLRSHVLPQDFEVIPVEERVHSSAS
jgi:hypothetical protein